MCCSAKLNPSGRLPITFPASEDQLPRPVLPGLTRMAPGSMSTMSRAPMSAIAGSRKRISCRSFPSASGSPTAAFASTARKPSGGATIAVSANVTNDGSVEGKETVEAYAVPPGPDEPARLIGWSKIDLAPGETHRVSITADPRLVAQFEVDRDRWHIAKGDYGVRVGTSSQSLGDMMHVTLDEQVLPP